MRPEIFHPIAIQYFQFHRHTITEIIRTIALT